MGRVDLSKYRNPEYQPGNIVKRLLWYVVSAVFFQTQLMPASAPKRFLLRLFGAKIGKGVVVKPSVHIKYPWFLDVGDYTWIGEKVWIDNLVKVTIGRSVCISQEAMLLTGNHDYKSPVFKLIVNGIELEDGVWIGARSTVSPGVKAHSHAVLTLGSVAVKNMDAYGVYSGNPAKWLRERKIS
ncbi:MAG: WcaF family extracellular polysaccharide biosynthesis acetyltransferase [Cryomorphaceae bacterium]|nr:WcaF family extracellular polysaccharide biosynthesis acetyltransferase [Flavobacteriales bacterium]